MDVIVVDDVPTAKIDSGDLIDACKQGLLDWSKLVPLEKIIAENRRQNILGRVLFKSHGIGDEDLAVASHVLKALRRKKAKARKVPAI